MVPHPNQPGQEHVLTRANAPSWLTPAFSRQLQDNAKRITDTVTGLSSDWAKQASSLSATAAHLQQFSDVMSPKEIQGLAAVMSQGWMDDLTKTLAVMGAEYPPNKRRYPDQVAPVIRTAPKPAAVATKETKPRGPKPHPRNRVLKETRMAIQRVVADGVIRITPLHVAIKLGLSEGRFMAKMAQHDIPWRDICDELLDTEAT